MLRANLKHIRAAFTLKCSEHTKFEILSGYQGYRLQVDGYSGDAGNSFFNKNIFWFCTKDRDQNSYNGRDCAVSRKGDGGTNLAINHI